MRTLFKSMGAGLIGLCIGAAATHVAMGAAVQQRLGRTWQVPVADVPVPVPGDSDFAASVERGEHLAKSRGGCNDCHGADYGGHVIIDALPVVGRFVGPNITSGRGGVVSDYTEADWVRIIRHGVNRDGTTSMMPSTDVTHLSDQEVGDMIAFMQSVPPVDRTPPDMVYGPMMRLLILTGQYRLSAETIDHDAIRPAVPPLAAVDVTYGEHVTRGCMGCHGDDLRGGPIPGAPPDWPAASDLTPSQAGLQGWSYTDYERVMRTGVRPDGRQLHEAMPLAMTREFDEVELRASWAFLQSLQAGVASRD